MGKKHTGDMNVRGMNATGAEAGHGEICSGTAEESGTHNHRLNVGTAKLSVQYSAVVEMSSKTHELYRHFLRRIGAGPSPTVTGSIVMLKVW